MTTTTANRSNTSHESALADDMHALRADLKALKDDFKHLASTAVDEGKTRATAAKDTAALQLDKSVEATRHAVEERPLTSLLIAAGIGALVGIVVARK